MSEAESDERSASEPSDPSSSAAWNSGVRASRRRRRRLVASAGAAAVILLLVAVVLLIGRDEQEPDVPEREPDRTTDEEPTLGSIQEDGGLLVSSSEYGESWPLELDSVVLRCEGDAVTLEADGKTYALNAQAQSEGLGSALQPIWSENPAVDGARMNIGVLIEQGLRVCR